MKDSQTIQCALCSQPIFNATRVSQIVKYEFASHRFPTATTARLFEIVHRFCILELIKLKRMSLRSYGRAKGNQLAIQFSQRMSNNHWSRLDSCVKSGQFGDVSL